MKFRTVVCSIGGIQVIHLPDGYALRTGERVEVTVTAVPAERPAWDVVMINVDTGCGEAMLGGHTSLSYVGGDRQYCSKRCLQAMRALCAAPATPPGAGEPTT